MNVRQETKKTSGQIIVCRKFRASTAGAWLYQVSNVGCQWNETFPDVLTGYQQARSWDWAHFCIADTLYFYTQRGDDHFSVVFSYATLQDSGQSGRIVDQ